MDKSPDWSLWRAFLAVAEGGSLSAAARTLGLTQPTLGRQIAALQATLGAELFTRGPRGLIPTETGAALLPHARAMRAAAAALALAAAGRATRLSGTVRITASVVVAAWHLPPVITAIRAAEPAIDIVVIPSDATSNLGWREADIALRMYRPTGGDLVARHLGDLPLCIAAARSYLDRRGRPRSAAELTAHDIIGYDRSPLIAEGFRAMGVAPEVPRFPVRTDDNLAYWHLLRAGCGIGFVQEAIARADPGVEVLDLGLALPALPLWLTTHESLRHTPRIARVRDMLAAGLRPLLRQGTAA